MLILAYVFMPLSCSIYFLLYTISISLGSSEDPSFAASELGHSKLYIFQTTNNKASQDFFTYESLNFLNAILWFISCNLPKKIICRKMRLKGVPLVSQ